MGQIITFYSYKGGTGRSMALANTAWILASRKKRVLVVDWDLEAPGLHRYFSPFLVDREMSGTKGVIDFIRNFAIKSATPPPSGDPQKADWYVPLTDIVDYAVSARWDHFRPGRLDFISAGQQDASYATRVNSFSWDDFYEKRGGGPFLEKCREFMLEAYDYVLLDSRTGVSDTSGICTVHLPDTVVVCFTLNNQGIEGASSIAHSILTQRNSQPGGRRIRIFPVAMRVDTFEKAKLDKRRSYGQQKFKPFLDRLPTGYWGEVEVPYWGYYAYEELLATFGDEPGASNSMLHAFENLTRHLTDGDVPSLVPPPPEERRNILALFEEGSRSDTPAPVPSIAAGPSDGLLYDIYVSAHSLDGSEVAQLRQSLETRANAAFISGAAAQSSPEWATSVRTLLAQSRAFAFCEGRFGLSPWQLREISFAFEHQATQSGKGKEFPIIPVTLSTAPFHSAPGTWLEANAVDLRRPISDTETIAALTKRFNSGELRSVPPGANPFKGAAAYQELDAPLFSGREKEIAELQKRIESDSVLFLRGPSGVGKTSLIEAGLKPVLRRKSEPVWEIVSLSPRANAFAELATALVALWSTETNETARLLEVNNLGAGFANKTVDVNAVLRLAFQRAPAVNKLLIVVDHIEWLFLFTGHADRLSFLQTLQTFTEALPVTVLFTIRPEWEAAVSELMPAWRWVLNDGLVLNPLPASELRRMALRNLIAGKD
ncbi:MAG: AAA family ATPase, partial [Bryobacteraceae bacterium]|nr:AAA family ATPase [Bryobacteraceae bacterium]